MAGPPHTARDLGEGSLPVLLLRSVGATDRTAPGFEEALLTWTESNGSVRLVAAEPSVDQLGLIVAHWHVALSAVCWAVIDLLPLLLIDSATGGSIGASTWHGVIEALRTSITRLDEPELAVLTRVAEQVKGLQGSSFDLVIAGLSLSDREAVERLVRRLEVLGVVVIDGNGSLRITA